MFQASGSGFSSAEIDGEPSSANSGTTTSRRQRLLGLARATRDNYIPRFTGSVSQIASSVSSRALGGGDYYDEEGNVVLPSGTNITIYPSYSRKVDSTYYNDVRGWLSCPGVMSRKNRLILSLAKQITRYGDGTGTTEQAINKLEDDKLKQDIFNSKDSDASDLDSIVSEASSLDTSGTNEENISRRYTASPSNINSGNITNDELLKERLSSFIARSIPNAKVTITLGSETELKPGQLVSKTVTTDNNGHFNECIATPYVPSFVHVKSFTDESVFAFHDIMLIDDKGLGWISDIDDTIKVTGVVGDKRELMKNLLLNDFTKWKIPNVIKWYTLFNEKAHISFHYVSNSPWQLFSTIDKYFKEVKLPLGSVHLKQYTGNIISSLMEPSSSRKRLALKKLVEDFPNKRFICVGDSGEQDLEAYVDLAKKYPTKIVAIYIRYVENSLSDVDDFKILDELIRLTAISERTKSPPTKDMEDLIDLSDAEPPVAAQRMAKLPPMVPNKPTALRGSQLVKKPPLPDRNTSPSLKDSTKISFKEPQAGQWKDLLHNKAYEFKHDTPPTPPKRPTVSLDTSKTFGSSFSSESLINLVDNLRTVYNSHHLHEMEETDRKGYHWILRVNAALEGLRNTKAQLRFFTDNDEEFFKVTENIVKNHTSDKLV